MHLATPLPVRKTYLVFVPFFIPETKILFKTTAV